jgi:hypothetical protein
MAFNPFHAFRKHQKVFFAILTIICMITFVFSFGRGDLFQRLMAAMGAGRSRGPVVTTLYGKKVHEGDLDRVLRRRQLANEYMQRVVLNSLFMSMAALEKEVAKPTPPDWAKGLDPVVRQSISQFGRQFNFQSEAALRAVYQRMQEKGPDQYLETLAVAFGIEHWNMEMLMRRRPREDFLFGGTRKADDLLDFLVWKHQADRLGIELTDADLSNELARIAGFRDVVQEVPFETFVGGTLANNRANLGAADLRDALMDEFRVAWAQAAVLGQKPGLFAFRSLSAANTSPAVVTPEQFLRFFRDRRTTVKAALLPVDVEKYESQVQGQPSEQELRNLYEQYKDQEPAPDQREPGFKQPRRVRAQYVVARADSDLYKGKARAILNTYSDPTRTVPLGVLAGSLAGSPAGGPAAGATALALPLGFDPLRQEYSDYQRSNVELLQKFGIDTRYDYRDARLRGATVAGKMLAAGLAPWPAFSLPVIPGAAQAAFDRPAVQVVANSVLAGTDPYRFLFVYPYLESKEPSYADIRPQLVQRYEKRLAQSLVNESLNTFDAEVRKLSKKPKEEQAYIEKAAKEYGFQLYSMTDLRTQYNIANDPALQEVKKLEKEARAELPQSSGQEEFLDEELGRTLFQGDRLYDPQFLPTPLPEGTQVRYWRTEDRAPRVRPFEEVRDEVVAAWRLDRARALAREEARRINTAVQERKGRESPEELVKFLREQKQGEVFELDKVAQLVAPETEVQMGVPRRYSPYQVPPRQVKYFRYPQPDLAKQLTTELQKPGDSLVVRDRPMRHYYVAVLLARDVPSLEQFKRVYRDASGPNPSDPLLRMALDERQHSYNEEIVGELRRQAAPLDKDGNYVIPEDIRTRFAGRGGPESGE